MKEIERKWLFDGFLDSLQPIAEFKQSQSYLQFSPEVRIRVQIDREEYNVATKYLIETKSDGDLVREETKRELSKLEYYAINNLVGGHILKECKEYKLGAHNLLISRVDNSDFFYGEIEFDSENEANDFITPDYFGKEVTYDSEYKMKNYYRRKYMIKYQEVRR